MGQTPSAPSEGGGGGGVNGGYVAAIAPPTATGATHAAASRPIHFGFMIKSPANASAVDPDVSTGLHQWRKRYFVLLSGGPEVSVSRFFCMCVSEIVRE